MDRKKVFILGMAIGAMALVSCKNDSAATSEEKAATTAAAVPTVNFGEAVAGTDQNGQSLRTIALDSGFISMKEEPLQETLKSYELHPEEASLRIDLGRRYLELGRYEDAIRMFSTGIAADPESEIDYRYRGECYYHLQQFDRAMSDFEEAKKLAIVQPNQIEYAVDATSANTPVYNLHYNSYFLLGLVHFIKGEFDLAHRRFGYSWNEAQNDDLKAKTIFWMFLSLKKTGQENQATVTLDGVNPDMVTIATPVYKDLCTMFKGFISMDDLLKKYQNAPIDEYQISRFGVGMWYAFDGQTDKAKQLLNDVVATGLWTSEVYPIAQAELNRL